MENLENIKKRIAEIDEKYDIESDVDKLRELKKSCFEITSILVSQKKSHFNDENVTSEEIRNLLRFSKKTYQNISKKIFMLTPHFKQLKSNLELLSSNYDESLDSESKINIFKENVIKSLESSDCENKIKNIKKILKELKKDKKYNRSLNNKQLVNIIDIEISEIKDMLEKERSLSKELEEAMDTIVLTNNQKKILQTIDDIDYDKYSLNDIITVFTYYLSQNDIYENYDKVSSFLEYIKIELVEYISDNEDIPFELNYLFDFLKRETKIYNKKTKERLILKEILTSLKEICIIYKNNQTQTKDDPYFKIIDLLMKDTKNYLYIREILRRNKKICNIKYEGHHIAVYILDLYITNFKMMIKDKDSDYININYLQEIYFLFTQNNNFSISKEDKKLIEMKIREFKEYIKITLIKEKRKNAAIEEIKKMSSKNYYCKYSYVDDEQISDDLLCFETNRVYQQYKNFPNQNGAKEIFLFRKRAYNIEQKEDSYILTLYNMDLSKYIHENSKLDNYLYFCELNNSRIDDLAIRSLDFEMDLVYPVFAYELEFCSSGKIKNLKIYKDNIKITRNYNNINNAETKLLYELYLKSCNKNDSEVFNSEIYALNKHFESLLNQKFIEFIENEKLPYIYCGYENYNEKEATENLSKITNYLYYLDKSISAEIVNIFSNRIDKEHFSVYPIENGTYKCNLLNGFTYIGLTTQRMLNDLYFNQRRIEDPERMQLLKRTYLRKFMKTATKLNETRNYVDPEEIIRSRGKIRKNRKY